MAVNERPSALSRCRCDYAERASKARLFEHKDVRVRAGAREASGKGSRGNTMLPRPSPQARWFLGTFCRNKKYLARRRRAKPL
jgi:hypothetical protein